MKASANDPGNRSESEDRRSTAFVTAAEASMQAFLSVSAASSYQEQLERYATSLLDQGCTKPEWCLFSTVGDVPVARAALWALPRQPVPTDVVLIHADWRDPNHAAGLSLLGALHSLAASHGADELRHSVDSPPGAPQYQEHDEARIGLLERAGYGLLRDGLRWVYSGSTSRAEPPQELRFRTLPDVGEEAFVEAIASTYEGTRDSWIARSIEEKGRLEAARAEFIDSKAMEHRPEWWELAYTHDGALVGVIIAARNPSTAVIAYVGVVPEHRGRGFAEALVTRGTAQLLEGGVTEIRGDCDQTNIGMVKAFERTGYVQFARRRTYHLPLATSVPARA